MAAEVLVDMAETNLLLGKALPVPNPDCPCPDVDLDEPIHLVLTASVRVETVVKDVVA